jgi:RimJ/RimL family protein N-acetyltransferase
MKLSVREMRREELFMVVDYFINSDAEFLIEMGAQKEKLPSRQGWLNKLHNEFDKPVEQKEYYYILWLNNGQPVGHTNINFIEFGETAKMHLHLWRPNQRKRGMGEVFLRNSISIYFDKFDLQTLVCEPYAKNPAPNKILPKLGFEFVKEYETIPGEINFPQLVRKYVLTN